MEENVHKDKMEEFLKKSFEDHSENPPNDLWERIEEGLGPVSAPPAKVISFKPWLLAAAAAVVTSIFLFQHFYFKQQIDTLNKELEKTASELKQLDQESTTPQGDRTYVPQDMPKPSVTPGQEPVSPARMTRENTVEKFDHQIVKSEIPAKNTTRQTSGNDLPPAKTNDSGQENAPNPAQKAVAANQGMQDWKNEIQTENPVAVHPGEIQKEEAVTPPLDAAIIPSRLAMKEALIETSIPSITPNVAMMEVAKKIIPAPSHTFSLGAHATVMTTKEKMNSLRPVFLPDKKVFDDDTVITGQTIMAGLAVEMKAMDKLCIGSGLDYRKTASTSSHRPVFRFKDRHDHQGGTHHFEHDFEYNLNTPAGSVTIALRAESVDTSLQIPDDEEIELEIKTRQRLEYLSLPLYARYTLGNGKLRFSLKGGFLANFLLTKDFEISDIASANPHFRFEKKQQRQGHQESLKSVSFDYLAGVGMDYAVTSSLSLRLEPTIVGSLSSIHNDRHISSSQLSAGLNAGVMYHF